MPSDNLDTLGIEVRSSENEAQSLSLDEDVRGFTGMLVGLAIGIACWGVILMLWWLV